MLYYIQCPPLSQTSIYISNNLCAFFHRNMMKHGHKECCIVIFIEFCDV